MAAVYLQRLWRTTLGLYLGKQAVLPDLFSESLGLLPAAEGHGKAGLHALAEWHRTRSPVAYNRLAEYQLVMEHVLASLQRQTLAHEPASAG